MDKLLFFFCACFLLCLTKISAGNFPAYFNFPSDTNRTVATDTVPYVIDEEDIEEMTDSLAFFSANGLYSDWDTTRIHFPKFNVIQASCKSIP